MDENNKTRASFVVATPALCLACSSSLPPRSLSTEIYHTPCCARPICAHCLSSNPRLQRYNPCLACLGGVNAVQSQSSYPSNVGHRNVDGAVRDDDVFVVGDSDEDGEEMAAKIETFSNPPTASPALSLSQSPPELSTANSFSTLVGRTGRSILPLPAAVGGAPTEDTGPSGYTGNTYFIRSNDTVRGIALRLKVDERALCRLNNLPPSTLTTTPHLLHTRTTLVLPDSVRVSELIRQEGEAEEQREARIKREHAEKRLQTLTKEVDWRVAKAYVALADLDPNAQAEYDAKHKEIGGPRMKNPLEERAIDMYLDDAEWEARQRSARKDIPRSSPALKRWRIPSW